MDDDYLDLYLDYSEMLQEARAENAKLRELVADACMQLGGAWVRCTELRELVRDLYEMAYPECPSAFEAAFADRMRELGVEVDG